MSDPTYNQSDPAHATGGVTESAKEAAGDVASTVKEEARGVAQDAKHQARDLYHQVRREVSDQGSTQQQRAASGLHSFAGELEQMAGGVQEGGMATDLAQQAASRMRSLASWLETREPGDVLEEVRSFARRRPGTFIAAAAALGLVAGRMTRGLTDAPDESSSDRTSRLSATDGAPSAGGPPHDVGSPSTDVPTASMAVDDEEAAYATGSRGDDGLFDERVTSPATSSSYRDASYRDPDERGDLA